MRFPTPAELRQAMETLGVAPNTPWREVRRRYRELMATHHPDHGGDEERAKEITRSYQLLRRWWGLRWTILSGASAGRQAGARAPRWEDLFSFATSHWGSGSGYRPQNLAGLLNLVLILLGMGFMMRFMGPLAGLALKALPLLAVAVGIGILLSLVASLPEPEGRET